MTIGRRILALTRGLGSLGLLALLLVGPPAALVSFVGWPLPTTIPTFADIDQAVRVGIDDAVVVKALAVLAWVLWLQVALVIVAEVVAVLRGRVSRIRSVVPGLQAAIGRLVAGATLVATSFTPIHTAGAATLAPEPVAQLLPAPSPGGLPTGQTAPDPAPPPAPAPSAPHSTAVPADGSATLQVRRHDSWWAIAERTLGDGLRWRELSDLNAGRTMPDGHTIAAGSDLLRPGWLLVLPTGAVAGDFDADPMRASSPAEPAGSPAHAGDGNLPSADGDGTEVTVVVGDSMWSIAERHLAAAIGRPGSAPQVAIYWAAFVETNRDLFADPGNPDLIHVGQRFALPPVPGVLAASAPSPSGSNVTPTPARATPQESRPPATAPPDEARSSLPQAPDTTAPPDQPRAPTSDGSTRATRPPTTAGSAERTADAPSSAASPDDDDDSDASASPTPLLVGVASSLLAVGVVRAIRRGRRRRHHLAPGATPTATRDPALHRQLLVDADEDQIDTLGRALSNLAVGIANAGHTCRPLVVQHSPDHLDVLLDQPTSPAVAGWHAQANGEVWTADPDELAPDAPDAAAGVAAPLLVTIGQPDDGGQLYLDLEAARLVTLTGDRISARDLATTMATELAYSPLAANAQVILVGRDLCGTTLGDFDRLRLSDTWAGVAADLAAWNDQSRDALADNDWPSTFAARGHDADNDALIPLVVIATELPEDLDLLGVLTAGPAATAAVIVGDAMPGATVIDCEPDQLTLPQLGLACRPLTLDGEEVDAVADLLRTAEDTSDEQLALGVDPEPVETMQESNGADEPYRDPAHEILVRLLGDITVDGGTAPLTGKQTALVAYIALHRNISSDRIADAVWVTPAAVSPRKRLANTITKCRAAIGARHLPVAKDSRYTVGPEVATDIDLFERRVAASTGMPPDQEVELLRGALDLVRGPVFDYPSTERDSYSWVDVENWISTWELKVTSTAERAAALYLDLGEPTKAVQVAERTLRAVPTHPGLTEVLMQAHAANGDRLAVQRVYQAHVNALDQLDLDTVADSTAELYERLRAG
jgi:DNA-binding SARP family transcriptional activator/nucleoid-associated protein YgaU